MVVTSIFSISTNIFYPIVPQSSYIGIVVCKCCEFGLLPKLSFDKELNWSFIVKKTVWEKEKFASYQHFLLFSYSFQNDFSVGASKVLIKQYRVDPLQSQPRFSCVCSARLLKTLEGKGEIARKEQFLLFPQCFLPVWRTFFYFHQI